MYKARQYRKEGKLYAAWSDVGKLKVRRSEGSPKTVIRSLSDLQKIVEDAAPSRGKPTIPTTDGDGFRRITRGTSSRAK